MLFSSVLLFSLLISGSYLQWVPEQLNVAIEMRDAKFLIADVLLPPVEGQYPAIFIHTPYNKQFGGSPLPDELVSPDFQDRDNFAYVVVDQRGYYASIFAAIPSPNHGQDGYDVIDWIVGQNWSTGDVGTWGISAVGAVQYSTMSEEPPNLRCAVPSSAGYGFRYEQFYWGGVLQENYVSTLTLVLTMGYDLILNSPLPTDPLWVTSDWIYDVVMAPKIDYPILFITGWFDTHAQLKISSLDMLRTDDKVHKNDMKMIIGPWVHTQLGFAEQGNLSFPLAVGVSDAVARDLFDHFLLGLDGPSSAWSQRPTIEYYELGTDRWLSAETWPPNSTLTPFFKTGDGALVTSSQVLPEAVHSYTHDPHDPVPTIGGRLVIGYAGLLDGPQDLVPEVESRDDVLVYSTEVLTYRIRIAGRPTVRLRVSSDRPDTDFAVWLSDVYPDGRSFLMSEGIQMARYRDGYESETFMSPGQVYEVEVLLSSLSLSFEPGHQIRVSVASSNYPEYVVNGNCVNQSESAVAVNSIHLGGGVEAATALLLPVVEFGEGEEEDDGSMIAIYVAAAVGSVVGVLLLVAAIALVVVLVCVLRKKKGRSDVEMRETRN